VLLVEPIVGITGERVLYSYFIDRSFLFDFKLAVAFGALVDVFIILAAEFLPVANYGQEGALQVVIVADLRV